MRTKLACPIMGAPTGFHPDDDWGDLRDKWEQRFSGQAFFEHHMPRVIHAYQVKHPLCQVNPQYRNFLFHWTRLLLCGMISPTLQSF